MAGPTRHDVRVAAVVLVPMALLATYFRLYLRLRKGLLWWDDVWAFVASIGMVISFAGMIMFTDPAEAHSFPTKIAAYYMIDNGFYGVIWAARISLMLTVIRIAYGQMRTFLKYCIVAFMVTYLVLVAQVFWTCEGYHSWKDEPNPQCSLGRQVAIAQLITDILSDLSLIIAPSFLLTKMKGRRGLKIRLIAIFSSTILTTITSLVHAYAIMEDLGLLEFTLVVVETTTSLAVVNLTVIAAWVFNLNDGDDGSDGPAYANTFIRGRLSGRTKPGGKPNAFALKTFADDGGAIEITVDTVHATDDISDKRDARGHYDVSHNRAEKDKQPITWMAE